MRILIIGAGGMLGHKLWQEWHKRVETFVALRKSFSDYTRFGLFDEDHVINGVDVMNSHDLHRAFTLARPHIVVNAVGIIKQLKQAHDPVVSLNINSLFPHQLSSLCAACDARLIHISSDCVFSGHKGAYTEDDIPDPEDLYGRTKLLGEVNTANSVTIRTSIIGREIGTRSGLIEWFLSQGNRTVSGYQKAIYSGFTTIALSRLLIDIIENHSNLHGVWQASTQPINKYELLKLVNDTFDVQVDIRPDDKFSCDRSLDSSRLRKEIGFKQPSWESMIQEMYQDPTPYNEWK